MIIGMKRNFCIPVLRAKYLARDIRRSTVRVWEIAYRASSDKFTALSRAIGTATGAAIRF